MRLPQVEAASGPRAAVLAQRFRGAGARGVVPAAHLGPAPATSGRASAVAATESDGADRGGARTRPVRSTVDGRDAGLPRARRASWSGEPAEAGDHGRDQAPAAASTAEHGDHAADPAAGHQQDAPGGEHDQAQRRRERHLAARSSAIECPRRRRRPPAVAVDPTAPACRRPPRAPAAASPTRTTGPEGPPGLSAAQASAAASTVRVEAGAVAGVAGGALLVDLDQQRVAVAVEADLLDLLPVAGGLALDPVLLARAAPERRPAGGQRAVQRLVVHPAEHQHLAGVVLLHDRGHQPVGGRA